MSFDRSAALLAQMDKLISVHGESNPELLKDLLALRAELELARRRNRAADFSRAALQIAAWVKFIFDHLPPLDPP